MNDDAHYTPPSPPTDLPASRYTGYRVPRRMRRVLTSGVAGAVLLAGGVGIGVAISGGASAAPAAKAPAAHASTAAKCAQRASALRRAGHPHAARRAAALCRHPLLRLAAVGGMYGEVTSRDKYGTKTILFERGIVESVTGSSFVVRATDGTTMTWHIVAASVVRQHGRKVPVSKLAPGEVVFVAGIAVGTGTSGRQQQDGRLIRIRKAA